MAANTQLNGISVAGGDKARDIEVSTGVKIQVMMPSDPALLQTIRGVYSSAQTDQAIVTVASGSRIKVVRFSSKLDPAAVNVTIRAGFGLVNAPTTTGVVYSHPNLPGGLTDSEFGELGIGADGEDLRITTGTISGGNLEINASYYLLPTAGI